MRRVWTVDGYYIARPERRVQFWLARRPVSCLHHVSRGAPDGFAGEVGPTTFNGVVYVFQQGQAVKLPCRETGCSANDLNRNAKMPTRYVGYERWHSVADLEAHLRSAHITTLLMELGDRLARRPKFRSSSLSVSDHPPIWTHATEGLLAVLVEAGRVGSPCLGERKRREKIRQSLDRPHDKSYSAKKQFHDAPQRRPIPQSRLICWNQAEGKSLR